MQRRGDKVSRRAVRARAAPLTSSGASERARGSLQKIEKIAVERRLELDTVFTVRLGPAPTHATISRTSGVACAGAAATPNPATKLQNRRTKPATAAYGPVQNRVYHTAMETAMEQSASRTAPPPAPPPAPAAPLDLDQLGDRIAELSARIQAATYDLLCDLLEFDRRHGWEGFRSCAHWLNWRTGLDLGAAREKLRVAAALACGVLSYSKVRALSRVATPLTEARLLAVACGATAEQVERLVRGWRRVDREQAAAGDDGAQVRLARRGLSLRVDEDGMVVLRGRLLPEVGAVVLRALEAALEQVPAAAADGTECTASQRRADALGVVAESALAGKLDPGAAGDRYQVTVHVDAAALAAGETAPETARDTAFDAPEISAETCAGAPAAAASAPGGRTRGPAGRPCRANATAAAASAPGAAAAGCAAADAGAVSAETRGTGRTAPPALPAATWTAGETSAQPVAAAVTAPVADAPEHPDARHPAADAQVPAPVAPAPTADSTRAAGAAVIEQANGIHLAATAARRIACDAGRVLVTHAPDGAVLEVGRRTRTVPTPLRRALEVRDHHQCQFPGCQLRHCDAHHVVHWADGGATRLPNLLSLCRYHHRAVHEEGFQVVSGADGQFVFRRPDGAPLPAVPVAPRWEGAPLEPTEARLRQAGITIGPHTATPEWYGESLDLAGALDLLWEPPPAGGGS